MKSIINIINILCDNAVLILQFAVVAIIFVLLWKLCSFLYDRLMLVLRKILDKLLAPVRIIFFILLVIAILTPDPVPWIDEITIGGVNYVLHRV